MRTCQQTFKFTILLNAFLVSFTHPVSIPHYAPTHDKPTDYSFSYGVKDLHTGDVKQQWEKKDGNVVIGQYSLLEPDGSYRTVNYKADDKHGFSVVVKHNVPSQHPGHGKSPTSHKELNFNTHTQYAANYDSATQFEEPKNLETHEEDNFDDTEGDSKPIYEEEEFVVPPLPVDLTLLKGTRDEKPVPVSVSQLNPVEIDLTAKDYPQELSSQDLEKLFKDYYQSSSERVNDYKLPPFKPTTQLFKSGKKPATTPGLRNYSTSPKTKSNVLKAEATRNDYVSILAPPPPIGNERRSSPFKTNVNPNLVQFSKHVFYNRE